MINLTLSAFPIPCGVPDAMHQLQVEIPNMHKAVDYYDEETKCNIYAHTYIHLQALLN
jgi:hypothetical protein